MTKALELAKFGRETPPTGVVVGDSDAQTLSSKTFSDGPVFSGLNANGIPYLNASKVLSSSSTFVFDGTNVGLGIASPAATLHVNASGGGTIRASRSSVGGEYVQLDHDGTDGTLRVSGNNKLYLTTNGTTRVTVTGAGKVGVGTPSPTEILTISHSDYQALGIYRNLDYNSVGAMGVRMYFGGYVGTTATASAAIDGTLMTATTGRLSLSNLIGGTLTESLRIDTNGSVRIGGTFAAQSSTNEKLTVDGVSSQAATLSNSSDTYGTVYIKNRSTTAATIQPYLYFNDGGGGNRAGFGVKYSDASLHHYAQGGINWYIGSSGFNGLAATLTSTGLLINNSGGNSGVASAQLHVSANGLSNTVGTIRIEGANRGGQIDMYNATYPVAKIITDQSGNFAIQTSASFATSTLYDRLTIDTNGNVQITSATNLGGGKLDITSNATAVIQARSTATGTGDGTGDVTVIRAVTAGASWWANARYDAYSHTWGRGVSASATTGMLLNGSGNLAIGTTGNTAQKLNVNGAIWLLGNDDANYSTLISARYDSSNSFTMQTRLNSGTMSEFLALYSDGGGGNPRLALAPNGWKVGVGTTDPKNPLHVVDSRNYLHSTIADHTTNMSGIRVTNSNNGDNWAGIWFGTGSGLGTHWSGIAGARTASATTWGTHLAFYTHEDATVNVTQATERMRLDSGGKLGIGTTSPAATLHVVGTGSILAGTNPALGVSNPSYSGLVIGFDGSPNLAQIVATNPSNSQMAFYTKPGSGSAPIQRMLISYDGIISTPNNTFSDDRGFLSRNGTWPHSNGGYANYGSTYPYRSFSREANGNLTEYAFNMDIGTDGYGSSTQYWYLSIPTGATTWMATYDVEVWSAGWNWSQVTGYRRWTVHSQSNSWTVSLREDNAGASMVYLSCYATPVGSSSVKFGFAMTGGRGGFYVRITTVGTAFDGASSYQTNTNPF